jgi:hypothetical protein
MRHQFVAVVVQAGLLPAPALLGSSIRDGRVNSERTTRCASSTIKSGRRS